MVFSSIETLPVSGSRLLIRRCFSALGAHPVSADVGTTR